MLMFQIDSVAMLALKSFRELHSRISQAARNKFAEVVVRNRDLS